MRSFSDGTDENTYLQVRAEYLNAPLYAPLSSYAPYEVHFGTFSLGAHWTWNE